MTIEINGIVWYVDFVTPDDPVLFIDGSYTLGVTDIYNKCIFIADNLNGDILYDVISHEITHAWVSSFGYNVSTYCDEMISQIVEKDSDNIQHLANHVYKYI